MRNEIQSDSWIEGGKVEKARLIWLTACSSLSHIAFSWEICIWYFFHWGALCSSSHLREKLRPLCGGVMWLWNYKKGFSFCLWWMLTLGTTPMMCEWMSKQLKEVLLTAPTWGSSLIATPTTMGTWRAVSIWMSWVLAMESAPAISWCGNEVLLNIALPRIPWTQSTRVWRKAGNWALWYYVPSYAAWQQNSYMKKRSGNKQSWDPILPEERLRGSFVIWKVGPFSEVP